METEACKRKKTSPDEKCFGVGWDYIPPSIFQAGIGFGRFFELSVFWHTPPMMFDSTNYGGSNHEADSPHGSDWLQRCGIIWFFRPLFCAH